MKNGWIYIILVAINIALMFVLVSPSVHNNEVVTKAIQVGIVIVTFILFRMYLKDRGLLKEKK
ncbi:hypothetical protein [Macrococcoides caseolyticum]|uniref:hypothetical protein n=1 Tax=Macrococcoides caseolyticum TaxID=69966 RepID=UPI001F1DCBCC|nr:hypothetical protein [Macrococcus caseolyticus]MCE4957483.1 hypothetical protein [Macrococcus caseolyticus]